MTPSIATGMPSATQKAVRRSRKNASISTTKSRPIMPFESTISNLLRTYFDTSLEYKISTSSSRFFLSTSIRSLMASTVRITSAPSLLSTTNEMTAFLSIRDIILSSSKSSLIMARSLTFTFGPSNVLRTMTFPTSSGLLNSLSMTIFFSSVYDSIEPPRALIVRARMAIMISRNGS